MQEFVVCPLRLGILLHSCISRALWFGVKSGVKSTLRDNCLRVMVFQDLFASVDVCFVTSVWSNIPSNNSSRV